MAVAARLLRPLILLLYIFLVILFPMSVSIPDSEALLKLKKSFTNSKALDSWDPSSQPCTKKTRWNGLICYDGIVTGIHLQGMGLSGSIDVDALLEIPDLRTFSLVNNSFSGSIPELYRLGALKAVYLSGNQFSGHIPSDFFVTMTSLKKVWLSDNKFSGVIPSSLSQLPNLIELHIENNHFAGSIPAIDQPKLTSLNVSNNNLEGEIPMGLSKFDASSFTGNVGLCGDAVGKMCDKASNKNRASADSHNQRLKENDRVAAAIMTMAVVLLSLTVVAIVVMKRREEEKFDIFGMDKQDDAPVEVHVWGPRTKEMDSGRKSMGGSSMRKGSTHGSHKGGGSGLGGAGAMGDLVLVNDEKGAFGLTDLMKAAAEVLGNGPLGSSYKAMMSNGVAVVVKRMREMNRIAREGFEAEFRRLGKLRHCNVLTPLAYHYRKDEKLLIYEFIPKGSLLFVLHGDRGATHADLDWPARLKIIQGIARGLGYLHTELAPSDLPHGNLKSSNVLLSSNNEPLLSDYGFSPLINAAQLSHALSAYKAPEAAQYHKISPKCDVYCLGIIILEILTGKFPSQYLNGKGGTDVVQWVLSAIREGREYELFDPEIAATSANSLGEMGRLLYIGAACTEKNPEQRLDMREAIKRIEGIKVGGGSGYSQENRTIQLLPSLRDGYAESATVASNGTSFRQGHDPNTNSGRLDIIEDRSVRLNSNSFAFPIS